MLIEQDHVPVRVDERQAGGAGRRFVGFRRQGEPVRLELLLQIADVGRFEFPAMLVAEVVVRGGIDLELRALDWLYGTWLPRSRYVPDDQPCFEAWIGRPFQHGPEHFELLLQLPVKPDHLWGRG